MGKKTTKELHTTTTSSSKKTDPSRIISECFGDNSLLYGIHIKNSELRGLILTSAESTNVFNLVEIPPDKRLEALSAIIKSGGADILITDMLESIWTMVEFFGPLVSLVLPIETGEHRFWKVSFRSSHDGAMIGRR